MSSLICSLVLSIGSFSLALSSLIAQTETRLSLHRGFFLTSIGFFFWISLTDFCYRLLLETRNGLAFRKRFNLKLADCLDITNKIVSSIQAAMSTLSGLFICSYSCTRNFVSASTILSSCYAYFGAAYFIYDTWAMYVVYAAKMKEKLGISNGHETNGKAPPKSLMDQIPSFENGGLSVLNFIIYSMTKNVVMVLHHIYIGIYGLAVIAYLRGNLGDCIFGFVYMMEASTPFVSFRGILSILGLKEAKLYVINGLTMLVVFFLCRILLFPYIYYAYSLATNKTILETIYSIPFGCKVSTIIIALPQVYWFSLMVKGAIKVLFPSTKHSKSD